MYNLELIVFDRILINKNMNIRYENELDNSQLE